MKLKLVNSLSTITSKFLSLGITASLTFSPLTPAFAGTDALNTTATAGNTASALPDPGNICKRVTDAAEGNFVDTNGAPLLVTKDECLSMTRRQRNAPECKTPISTLIGGLSGDAKSAKIDSICSTGSGSLGQAGDAYCNLRQITKNSQTLEYCAAYTVANKASDGIQAVLALDAVAAGVCWAEYLTKSNLGICGGAAIAAGMLEVVKIISVFSKDSSAGKYRVDSSDNVQSRSAEAKTIGVILSSVLSLKGIQVGVCYYLPKTVIAGHNLCGDHDLASASAGDGIPPPASVTSPTTSAAPNITASTGGAKFEQAKNTFQDRDPVVRSEVGADPSAFNEYSAKRAKSLQAYKVTRAANANVDNSPMQRIDPGKVTSNLPTAPLSNTLASDKGAFQKNRLEKMKADAHRNLAQQAAIVFTGLTVMRGAAYISAQITKRKTKELLQSMFQSSAGGTSFGGTGMGANNGNMFAAATASGFPTDATQPIKSAATATPPGSLESFLAPPGSPLGDAAAKLASQIPSSKLDSAAAGGASGAAGLVAMAATAAGAKGDLSPINGIASSVFANMPKDDGGYSGGGGAPRLAGGGKDSGGDLNLKSLFGGGDKEGEATSPGRTDIAFREPASEEDIWHTQNPSGNNLFQIISNKYDHVQRRSSIGTGL